MAHTTQRVLRLLGLLEARTSWQARELGERLGVTERTVRRDVTRLRELGYPVEGERGVDGGYRLGAGGRLPPLLLDDDEAIALVACLRMAALSGSDEVGEAALRSLVKLEQILPPGLRALTSAVDAATIALPRARPPIVLKDLQQLATAQRDRCVVRFEYRKPAGEVTSREVEPARLMTQGEYWYLQGFDRWREDWRVFRLDRMSDLRTTTWHFPVREAPSPEFRRDLASRYPCVLHIQMDVDMNRLASRLPAGCRERLEPTETGCRFLVGAPSWDGLAWHMLWLSRDLQAPLILSEGPGVEPFVGAMSRIADQALGANFVRRTSREFQALRQATPTSDEMFTTSTPSCGVSTP